MSDQQDAYKGTPAYEVGMRVGSDERRRTAYRAEVVLTWPEDGYSEITVSGPDKEYGTNRYNKGRGNQRTGTIRVRFEGSPWGGGIRIECVPYDDLADFHRQLGVLLADPRFRADAERARALNELERRSLLNDLDGDDE